MTHTHKDVRVARGHQYLFIIELTFMSYINCSGLCTSYYLMKQWRLIYKRVDVSSSPDQLSPIYNRSIYENKEHLIIT